jgi:hypothetical protein
MPRAIPTPIRQQIIAWCQSGLSLGKVSEQSGYTYAGVAKVWRAFRLKGECALQPDYSLCGRPKKYGEDVEKAIEGYASSNPNLGAPYIRSKLLAQGDLAAVPHERTIQRSWKRQGRSEPRGRRPRQDNSYAQEPHHTWQVDGKELVRLSDGSEVCYLSMADEACGAFLKGVVFPPVPPDEAGQWATGEGRP